MRCVDCPAMQNLGGYEYLDYQCVLRNDIREYKSGWEGCLLRPHTIERRLACLAEERKKMYAEENRKYILAHEIEQKPEVRGMCVDAMKHAVGLTGSGSKRHRPYRRHGKLFYKPWRNTYATSRSGSAYPAWNALCLAGLADVSPADDAPCWEERDMREVLYYTVTPKGLKWLQGQLETETGEVIHIHGAEK